MTIGGATYQTILNRLVLQSCQLYDTAHDFRYDPCICYAVICGIRVYELSLGCYNVVYSASISFQGLSCLSIISLLPIFTYGTKFYVQCHIPYSMFLLVS